MSYEFPVAKYIGQLVELRQQVFIDDNWEDFRVTGWLAKVVEQEGELIFHLDDKSDYLVEDGGQVVRNSKVSDLTHLMRFRKPTWEINPGGWQQVEGMWEPKPTEPKAPGARCSDCSRADCPVVPDPLRSFEADIVVLGEAPGYNELLEGSFWVGRAGQLLREVENQTGLAKYVICRNNACLCHKDATPTKDEIEACRDRLISELVAANPKVIIPTGNIALQALLIEGGITQRQGLLFDYKLSNGNDLHCKVIPAFHPAAVLRRPETFIEFTRALSKAVMYLEGQPLLDVQPKDFRTSDVVPLRVVTVDHESYEAFEVGYRIETEAKDALAELSNYKGLTADLETTGFDPYTDLILCVSIAGDEGDKPIVGYTFKWEMLEGDDELFDLLKELLETREVKYFNGVFDCAFLNEWGIAARIGDDIMLKYYTMDERPFLQGLKAQGRAFCNAPRWDAPLKAYLPSKSTSFAAIPYEILSQYAALDSCYTGTLDVLYGTMMDGDAKAVYDRILLPAANMLLDASRIGIKVDLSKIEELREQFQAKVAKLREALVELAWEGFNPNSTKDCSRLFHDQLGLTDEGEGTGRPVMERVDTSEARLLIEYRSTNKLLGTYIEGIQDEAVAGRIHPNLRLNGTVTGRLASGKEAEEK